MSDFNLKIGSRERSPNYAVAMSSFDGGSEERRLIHEEQLNSWKFTSPALTRDQAQEYIDFFDSMYGSLNSFTWTDIDGTEYTVRFALNSFKIKSESGYFRVTWEFEKVF